jgi:hypothetical protein
MIVSPRRSPIEIVKCGMPCRKLVVSSSVRSASASWGHDRRVILALLMVPAFFVSL